MSTNAVYQYVTDRIIAKLEAGTIPWVKPWNNAKYEAAYNAGSGRVYTGINALLLDEGGYMTINQINEKGWKVKKGSKSHMVTFWKINDIVDEAGNPTGEKSFYLRYYNVFHESNIEGYVKPERPRVKNPLEFIPVEAAHNTAARYMIGDCIPYHEGGNAAYYTHFPVHSITMPRKAHFKSIEAYYATLFHEMGHSTMRGLKRDRPSRGDEEGVAELCSAYLMRHFGLSNENLLDNTADYIKGWIRKLRDDPKLIVTTAGKAQKAMEYILEVAERTPYADICPLDVEESDEQKAAAPVTAAAIEPEPEPEPAIPISYPEFIQRTGLDDTRQAWIEWKSVHCGMDRSEATRAAYDPEWGWSPINPEDPTPGGGAPKPEPVTEAEPVEAAAPEPTPDPAPAAGATISVSLRELKRATAEIKRVLSTVKKSSIRAMLETVTGTIDKYNGLTLQGTNTEQALKISINGTGPAIDATFYVNIAELEAAAKSAIADPVTLDIKPGTVTIDGMTIMQRHAESAPGIMQPEAEKTETVTMQAEELQRAIAKTISFVSNDDCKPILTGVNVKVTDTGAIFAALDGYKLSVYHAEIDSFTNDINITIPAAALAIIARNIKKGPAIIRTDGRYLSIKDATGDRTITTRLLEGEYVDYEKIIPTEHATSVTISTAAMLQAIKPACGLQTTQKYKDSDGDSHRSTFKSPFKLHIRRGAVTVEVNSDTINYSRELSAVNIGKPLDIAFNAKLIIPALESLDAGSITIQLNTAISPAYIEQGKHKVLVLPVRMHE